MNAMLAEQDYPKKDPSDPIACDRFSLLFVLLLEFRHDRGVRQRRGIPQGMTVGDVSQKPPHDLAAPGLGKLRSKENLIGSGNGPDLLCHMTLQPVYQVGGNFIHG